MIPRARSVLVLFALIVAQPVLPLVVQAGTAKLAAPSPKPAVAAQKPAPAISSCLRLATIINAAASASKPASAASCGPASPKDADVAILSIYAQKPNAFTKVGHTWIEIYRGGTASSYGLFPEKQPYAVAGKTKYTSNGLNRNVELSYKKDQYLTSVHADIYLSKKQADALSVALAGQMAESAGKYRLLTYNCADWAVDVWNAFATQPYRLSARWFGTLEIAAPNYVAQEIKNLNLTRNVRLR